jgi:hypothetical protein
MHFPYKSSIFNISLRTFEVDASYSSRISASKCGNFSKWRKSSERKNNERNKSREGGVGLKLRDNSRVAVRKFKGAAKSFEMKILKFARVF